jgi:hypothetical protein
MSDVIDWSKAPEWADKHGFTGAFKSAVWFNYEKYSYVDRQQDGKVFFYCDACTYTSKDFSGVTERPQPTTWFGEGLPPVGVRCEASIPHISGPDNARSFIWIEGSVIAYYEIKGTKYAWFAEDDGFYPPAVLEFRPIRTPEQIAADEREAAVKSMLELDPYLPNTTLGMMSRADFCRTLYDNGYRKQ